MALHKISDFDSDYRDSFQGNDIKGMSVYAQGTDEKIGSVSDVLVDDEGHLRYFIVDLGFWIFGKKVLLPVGRSKIDYGTDRVYAIGMTREQAESLPEFSDRLALDYDYEENVRGVYRNSTTSDTLSRNLEASAPLESSAALGADTAAYQQPATTSASLASTPIYNRDTYSYREEPSLYEMNEQDHQTLKLYEERLIANKQRRKTGEVTVGKHVETETAHVAVPLDKERVVIERVTPADAGRTVDASQATFREGEVARMEIYEEIADVRKEAFVREEVQVKKVVDQETVEAKETIRREELDVNAPGLPIDER
jgi:uncharacterized protein (TIGR02271 family)